MMGSGVDPEAGTMVEGPWKLDEGTYTKKMSILWDRDGLIICP